MVTVRVDTEIQTAAEANAWRGSLEDRPPLSRKFYAVVAAAMLLGWGMNSSESMLSDVILVSGF